MKNPEYLSILDKKAIKNGKIDDKTQVEQVSVMNKLLNDALRAKGYKGPDIKMVLTDVKDPNEPYYTDTLTNVVVFDRKELAKSNRDQILNALGHEFGHYSKEDNKTGSQTIANYSGEKLEARTRGMVSKEAGEEILTSIRNNPNVITGEEGKKVAESIPMDRREYKVYQFVRPLDFRNLKNSQLINVMKKLKHGYIVFIPDEQSKYFKDGKLKEEYKNYPKPKIFDDGRLGWTIGAHDVKGKLELIFNQEQDLASAQDYFDNGSRTPLKAIANKETLRSTKYKTSDKLGNSIMEDGINYKNNNENGIAPKYFGLGFGLGLGYNCNSWTNKIADRQKITNFKKDMPGIDIGDFGGIDNLYFKKFESKRDGKNEKK